MGQVLEARRGGIQGIGRRGITCRDKGRRGIIGGSIEFFIFYFYFFPVLIGLGVRVAPLSLGFE